MQKTFTHIHNALFMPLSGVMDRFTSGVFSQGVCLRDSLLTGRSGPAEPREAQRKLSGSYLFGGYFFNHYGHFLTETLSRLYAWRQCPPFPLLFTTPNSEVSHRLARIFKTLGIRNEILMIQVPVEVENLIVSPEGCILTPPYISAAQVEALGQVEGGEPTPGKKIWLSRGDYMRSMQAGGVINEKAIEKALAAEGWGILSPESLGPVQNQVKVLCSAEQVAGFDGSAFLTALLAKKVSGRFTLFGRSNSVAEFNTFALRTKGIVYETHVPEVVEVSGRGATKRWFLPRPESVLDVLLGGKSGKAISKSSPGSRRRPRRAAYRK
jgi:hypothetical protein